MDHPAGGGMTGEDGGQPPAEDAEDGTAPDEFDGQTGQDERA
jgi:hypothetical protein